MSNGPDSEYEQQCSGRMWGVFYSEDDSAEPPIAAFRSEADADRYIKALVNDPDTGHVDYCIMRTDIYATCWNNCMDPDPKLSFENFIPSWLEGDPD